MVNWIITIPGNPIPKGRPRVVKGRVFTPRRTRDYERLVSQYAALKWTREPTRARLFVSMRFYRETAHRCDLSNLVKSVEDGLQGIVFVDDEQIDELHIRREVDRDNPRVEVWVRDFREIGDMDDLRMAAAQVDWLGYATVGVEHKRRDK